MRVLCVCAMAGACLLPLAPVGSASSIVSVTGPEYGDFSIGYLSTVISNSWTSTAGYTNVTIQAEVGSWANAESLPIYAYLTNAIGPGLLPSNVIATSTVMTSSTDEWDTMFSGLTLGPGTYYLTLSGVNQISGAGNSTIWWGDYNWQTPPPTYVMDGFTTYGTAYVANPYDAASVPNLSNPPGSIFVDGGGPNGAANFFTVSGTLVGTPEPGTISLAAGAALLLATSRRRGARV